MYSSFVFDRILGDDIIGAEWAWIQRVLTLLSDVQPSWPEHRYSPQIHSREVENAIAILLQEWVCVSLAYLQEACPDFKHAKHNLRKY